MQQQIQIIESYPDLGLCCLHMKQNMRVCLQCKKQKRYFCRSCDHDKNHKTVTSQQYVKDLARKIYATKPSQQNRQSLNKTFTKLTKTIEQFENGIQGTIQILKQINLRKYIVYSYGISYNEDQIYEQLCDLQLKQNGNFLQKIVNEIKDLKLDQPGAPTVYQKWLQGLTKQIDIFIQKIDLLRQRAFLITSMFDFSELNSKIRNYRANSPQKSISKYVLDLSQTEDSIPLIIQKVKAKNPNLITSLIINNQSLSTQALQQLLINSQIKFENLQKLIIKNNVLQSDCIQVLLRSNLTKLNYVNFQGNFIQIDVVQQELQAINKKWPNIQVILFSD